MSLEPIKRILPSVVGSHGLTGQLRVRRVVEAAAVVIGALWGGERAQWVTPTSFKEGVLTLEVRSAGALQELRLDSTRLQNEINRHVGERAVTRIFVRSVGF